MTTQIKKAIFPVAGLGTRFLPVTKASPKEMLPIVDKPLIQYAVEEAIEAGIEEMIFVTSGAKRAIEDHFDRNFELEKVLFEKQKFDALHTIQQLLPKNCTVTYIRQSEPLGLGHAILCAKHLIGNETFAILLADDLMYHTESRCLAQMVSLYHEKQIDGAVAIQTIDMEKTNQYGVVGIDADHHIKTIIEKPEPNQAPSNLAIAGRYILPPTIFMHLAKMELGAGNEIQLTDAISKLLVDHQIYAHAFSGVRYDCGSKLGYAQANFDYMMRDQEYGKAFSAWIEERLGKKSIKGEIEETL